MECVLLPLTTSLDTMDASGLQGEAPVAVQPALVSETLAGVSNGDARTLPLCTVTKMGVWI